MTASAPAGDAGIPAGRARTADRLFFTSYTLAVAVILFVGFAPSFYLRGIAPPASGYRHAPPSVAPIAAALAIPTVPVLAILLILGWRFRTAADAHKRFMLVIAGLLTDPAFNRLPLWPPTLFGLYMSEAATFAMMAPLWIWDFITRGKPHWATAVGSCLLLILIVGRILVWSTPGWAALLQALPGFGWP